MKQNAGLNKAFKKCSLTNILSENKNVNFLKVSY